MKSLKVKTRKVLGFTENSKTVYIWNLIITFLLMTVAWTFFRANNVDDAFKAVSMMMIPTGNLYLPQLSLLLYIIMGIIILVMCDILQEKNGYHPLLENRNIVIRFLSYIDITIIILAFGVFDGGQFIYFQF